MDWIGTFECDVNRKKNRSTLKNYKISLSIVQKAKFHYEYAQDGKESLYVSYVDELYTFDLIEVHVKILLKIDLDFEFQNHI